MSLVNPTLNANSLFLPWHTAPGQLVSRGSLISFGYPSSQSRDRCAIHDPSPMVIITDVNTRAGYIRGVNLHYLTVPDVKGFLLQNARNPNFTYTNIVKPNAAWADSFRMYYFRGMINKRRLDTDFLLQLLNAVRSFSPSELERVRNELRQQIQRRTQAKAAELNAYTEWQNRQRQQQQPIVEPIVSPQPPQPTVPAPQPFAPAPAPVAPAETNVVNEPNR